MKTKVFLLGAQGFGEREIVELGGMLTSFVGCFLEIILVRKWKFLTEKANRIPLCGYSSFLMSKNIKWSRKEYSVVSDKIN